MPNFGDLFGGSNIKSIQRGVISVAPYVESQDVSITAVNPAFTVLRMLGVTRSGSSSSGDITAPCGHITLTGGGASITATSQQITKTISGTNTTVTRYVSWELTEYYPS